MRVVPGASPAALPEPGGASVPSHSVEGPTAARAVFNPPRGIDARSSACHGPVVSDQLAHRITLLEFPPQDGKSMYATQCSCGWESRRHDNSAGADHEAARHLTATRSDPFPGPRSGG